MTRRILISRLLATAAIAALAQACGPSDPPEQDVCGGEGILCHVAGTGEGTFNGDGRSPEETALHLPTAARTGPDGQLYVMDFNNMRLRCLLAEGTIDTVVGSGEHAYAIAGNDALESPLENPIDFAFAPDGRLLFVSLHDPRVLRVEHDGTLGVLAGTGDPGDEGDGGPATQALFNQLAAIAVAPDGSVFVSDSEAHRVRVIRPDGTIHGVAGTGEAGYSGDGGPATAATINYPQGLALDAAGNLYFADSINHRIRRIDAQTGLISTFAGSGTGGLSGDGGPAAEAQLQWPAGVTVAPDGRVYIADTFNHRVRRVDEDGTISTVAGTHKGYSGDGGPAAEAQLKGPTYLGATEAALFIADTQNQVVRVLHLR